MKKLAILFLLITVLASFTFAQDVSIKGTVELQNVAGGNNGDLTPKFTATADASKSVGSFTLSATVEEYLEFGDNAFVSGFGDVLIKGAYAIAAGPGSLGFYLQWYTANELEPGITYSGLAAGPVTLGFGAYYKYDYANVSADPFEDTGSIFGAYIDAAFDFGLYLKYDFRYKTTKGSDIARIAYVDANYRVIDPLVVGVELDDTGKEFKGFTLKPYVNYDITDALSAGAYFKVQNINAADGTPDDILFSPGVWIKYAL